MIDAATVQLKIEFGANGNDEIIRNIKTILTTRAGTVVMDRDFGVNMDIADLPMEAAKNRLTVEYIKKVKKYEPRAEVKKVTFGYDAVNGILKPKVVIGLVK
jgi:phage baseplate assembly protein W